MNGGGLTADVVENGVGPPRASPASSAADRERRLKARMAELADKNRAVTDDSGNAAPPPASAPAPAPRTASTITPAPRYTTTSSLGGGVGSSLEKGSYSSYRYAGFTSRLKSYDGVAAPVPGSEAPSPTGSNPPPSSSTATSVTATVGSLPAASSVAHLSNKRDIFFRDGPTSLSASSTANGTTSAPSRDQDDGSTRLGNVSSSSNSNSGGNSALKEKMNSTSANAASATSKEVEGYVGFANLPNQVYRKAVKRGFEFTLMVVGEAGLGKSTLINSMFLSDIYSNEYPGPSQRSKKTVQVDTSKVLLKENGVNLQLTVVDTPGFGDAVDNSNCWQPIIDYIESQSEDYLNAESRVNRRSTPDNRVHSCLYFIAPSGHGLKPVVAS